MDSAVDQILAEREQLARPHQAVAGLLVALALHGGVVALFIFLPRLMPPPPPLDYVAVQVVPAQRLGAEHHDTRRNQETPPRPAPKPAAEEPPPPTPPKTAAPVLPQIAPPKPAKPPKPEKVKPPVPDNRVDPTTLPKVVPPPREVLAHKLAVAAPPPAAVPPPAGAAGPGGPTGTVNGKAAVGSSIAALDNPDFTYDYYIAQLLSRIDQNWVRPPTSGGVQAVISFRIQSDGSITELAVRQSSSNETFDLAALRAVQNAAPFPPLPRAYTAAHTTLGVNLNVR